MIRVDYQCRVTYNRRIYQSSISHVMTARQSQSQNDSPIRFRTLYAQCNAPRLLNGGNESGKKRYNWFIYIVAFVRNVNTR